MTVNYDEIRSNIIHNIPAISPIIAVLNPLSGGGPVDAKTFALCLSQKGERDIGVTGLSRSMFTVYALDILRHVDAYGVIRRIVTEETRLMCL